VRTHCPLRALLVFTLSFRLTPVSKNGGFFIEKIEIFIEKCIFLENFVQIIEKIGFFSIFFIIFLQKNDFFIKNGYILDIFPKEAVWVNYYCVKWEFYGLFSVFVLGAGHQNPYTATTATVRHCQ